VAPARRLPDPRFDWTAKRRRFFAISALVVVLSATSLAVRGLNYGIDFTGARSSR
jgi:preprotein translocase subunit SecF